MISWRPDGRVAWLGLRPFANFCIFWTVVHAQGLTFERTTIDHNGYAFHMANETLEVTCVAPESDSHSIHFEVHKVVYNTSSHRVSIVNSTAIKLALNFNRPIPYYVELECYDSSRVTAGEPVLLDRRLLHIDYGLLLVNQTVNCSTYLPDAGSLFYRRFVVECDLTINFNAVTESYYDYTVHFLPGRDQPEELLASANSNVMPIKLRYEVDAGAVFNSTEYSFRTVISEILSKRNATLQCETSVVETLVLPPEMLQWKPLPDGSGFIIAASLGNLSAKCGDWKYRSTVWILSAKNGNDNASSAPRLDFECKPCGEPCVQTVAGLNPGTSYLVELRHALFSLVPEGTPATGAPKARHRFYVKTEEQEPLAGPAMENYYQTYDCGESEQRCHRVVGGHKCVVAKVFWKALKENEARGVITEYQIQTSMNGHTLEKINLSSSVRSAEICWDGRNPLAVLIAGKTSKGFPASSSWSKRTIYENTDLALKMNGLSLRKNVQQISAGCTLSWLLPKTIDTAMIYNVLHCENEASGRCSIFALDRSEVVITAWKSYWKYSWKPGPSEASMCNAAVVAVSLAALNGSDISMARFVEVRCMLKYGAKAKSELPEVRVSTHADRLCLDLPSSLRCDDTKGPPIYFTFHLSQDGTSFAESVTTNIPHHCFEGLEAGQRYNTSVLVAVDDGSDQPMMLHVVNGMWKTTGLSSGEWAGAILGGVLLSILLIGAMAACAAKVYSYRKSWKSRLRIAKIKTAHHSQSIYFSDTPNSATAFRESCINYTSGSSQGPETMFDTGLLTEPSSNPIPGNDRSVSGKCGSGGFIYHDGKQDGRSKQQESKESDGVCNGMADIDAGGPYVWDPLFRSQRTAVKVIAGDEKYRLLFCAPGCHRIDSTAETYSKCSDLPSDYGLINPNLGQPFSEAFDGSCVSSVSPSQSCGGTASDSWNGTPISPEEIKRLLCEGDGDWQAINECGSTSRDCSDRQFAKSRAACSSEEKVICVSWVSPDECSELRFVTAVDPVVGSNGDKDSDSFFLPYLPLPSSKSQRHKHLVSSRTDL